MKENEFRYLVIQSLIVLTQEVRRVVNAQSIGKPDTALEDLAERLQAAKEEAMQ